MNTANEEAVLYAAAGGVASVTMNRPQFHNALNAEMLHALDAAFQRAMDDPHVKVIVLRGAGTHFSVGHETGTLSQDQPGGQGDYLAMCRRWRALPKPTIAMIQGACTAGGLMLAWSCDLILASEDAFFSDPFVRGGVPDAAYCAHACEFNPRIAKEFLLLGERMHALRAHQMGMVNRVLPRPFLEEQTYCIARRIAHMPAPGVALAKRTINAAEDRQGRRTEMPAVFAGSPGAPGLHDDGQFCQ